MKRLKEKSLNRIENKKRKVEAFLHLVKPQNDKTSATTSLTREKCGSGCEERNNNNIGQDEHEAQSNESTSKFINNDYVQLKKHLKDLKKLKSSRPQFFLKEDGMKASLNKNTFNSDNEDFVISINQVQSFLLACLLPAPRLSRYPDWCDVLRSKKASKVSIFILDGVDFSKDVKSHFSHIIKFEVSDDWVEKLLNIPLSNRQVQKLHKIFLKNVEKEETDTKEEKISRTSLLLSPLQLAAENFPLSETDYRCTKERYLPVQSNSPIFGLDCEMCLTIAGINELTRISVVNESMEVVLNSLVKPRNKIINYLTKYSGITKEILKDVKTTLEDVQEEICNLLPSDAILCGQSLNFDLHALKLIHPYIIDTSVIYNLSGFREIKSSLKILSANFLGEKIQSDDKKGHDSIEDSFAALKLVKLKLNKGLQFGDRVTQKDKTSEDDIFLTISNYLERFEEKVNVFYNYFDNDSDTNFITVVNNKTTPLSSSISKAFYTERSICIVLTNGGLCYIKI